MFTNFKVRNTVSFQILDLAFNYFDLNDKLPDWFYKELSIEKEKIKNFDPEYAKNRLDYRNVNRDSARLIFQMIQHSKDRDDFLGSLNDCINIKSDEKNRWMKEDKAYMSVFKKVNYKHHKNYIIKFLKNIKVYQDNEAYAEDLLEQFLIIPIKDTESFVFLLSFLNEYPNLSEASGRKNALEEVKLHCDKLIEIDLIFRQSRDILTGKYKTDNKPIFWKIISDNLPDLSKEELFWVLNDFMKSSFTDIREFVRKKDNMT